MLWTFLSEINLSYLILSLSLFSTSIISKLEDKSLSKYTANRTKLQCFTIFSRYAYARAPSKRAATKSLFSVHKYIYFFF